MPNLQSTGCATNHRYPAEVAPAEVRQEIAKQALQLSEEHMITLWNENTPYFDEKIGQELPTLTPYLLADKNAPCVIICPGGGYTHRAYHEGEPVAQWLNTCGYAAFVLNYRFTPYPYQAILGDVLRAVRLVRHGAKEYGINPEKLGVLGFSAGAHLASCAALAYDLAELDANDPIDKESSRADFAILCYGVITFREEFAHYGSRKSFLGSECDNLELVHRFSGELQVRPDTPPMFLWHTFTDRAVSVKNSLRLCEALAAHKVPCELHIYPSGNHGQGLATKIPRVCEWTTSCANWLKTIAEENNA